MRRGGRESTTEALMAYEDEGEVWATGGICCVTGSGEDCAAAAAVA